MHSVRDKVTKGPGLATSHWRAEHLARLRPTPTTTIPAIPIDIPRPLIAGLDLWDMWPAQLVNGETADFAGTTLWFVLSAPIGLDPDLRHFDARIRLLTETDGQWRDCGNALPDDLNPGSREWAGSAIVDPETHCLTLFFTAAGHRGDAKDNWAQRLFEVDATVDIHQGAAALRDFSAVRESVAADNRHYLAVGPDVGVAGFIKGFRDPAFFADPATANHYLLFTASLRQSTSDWNGAIGIAEKQSDGQWQALPPLVSMDGVNNEPERPHIVAHDGRYYLFFSTQTKMFEPDVPAGPNGLYAMVADTMAGPWQPVNGSGLVAANPESAPFQGYSWWVTSDLVVHSFADMLGAKSENVVDNPHWRRSHFGGVPAPRFHLHFVGDTGGVTALS